MKGYIMHTDFTPLSLEEHQHYLSFWQSTPQRSIDYALANIWGWGRYFEMEWRVDGPLCWLRQNREPGVLWAPVGDWRQVDWTTQSLLRDGATLVRVPEVLAHLLQEALPGRVQCEETRGHWEYLYKTEELALLPGNRFSRKRNHVNGYRKAYGKPDYRPFDAAIMEDVLALQDEWCQWHECANSPALQAENEAINRVLAHWEELPELIGGAVYAGETLVAFSVGEKLDDQTLGIHYEKAHSGYRGAYQVMNNVFAANAGQGYALLNRAQDLDEEGLRQAKLTYQPTDFLRKYTLTIAPA